MPINAFGGGPGSGKTYGVIEHVILPAVARGRFVITNIDGLDVEAIYAYVAKEFYKDKILCIGHIRHCDRAAPDLVTFFPGEDALDKAMPVPLPDAPEVCGGDLVVVDEATRYWSQGEKVKKEHAYFFREHRHFANEMGHTCDLVVIDPDLTMLARALKGKVEMASVTHKPKEIGMDKRYVVKMFRGVKLTGKPQSVNGPYKFRSEIYSLYRSYAVAGAKEQAVDGRQSLKGKIIAKFVAMLVLLLSMVVVFVYMVKHKIDKVNEASPKPAVAVQASAPAGGLVHPPTGSSYVPSSTPARSSVSERLRVAGEVVLRGERWVVLADGSLLRLENARAFVGSGSLVVGNVEGERVSTWSGVRPAGEVK
jgi:zona occludens toxin